MVYKNYLLILERTFQNKLFLDNLSHRIVSTDLCAYPTIRGLLTFSSSEKVPYLCPASWKIGPPIDGVLEGNQFVHLCWNSWGGKLNNLLTYDHLSPVLQEKLWETDKFLVEAQMYQILNLQYTLYHRNFKFINRIFSEGGLSKEDVLFCTEEVLGASIYKFDPLYISEFCTSMAQIAIL